MLNIRIVVSVWGFSFTSGNPNQDTLDAGFEIVPAEKSKGDGEPRRISILTV